MSQLISQPTPPHETPSVEENAQIGGVSNDNEGWKGIISTIAILIAAPLMALLVISFIFQTYQVDGPSMQETLQNSDRLIVNKVPRTWARITHHNFVPHRGDVIIFNKVGLLEYNGRTKQLIKRVIGLPGERVVVSKGKVTVYNAQNPGGFNPDKGSKWSQANTDYTMTDTDVVVGSDEVFVLGDHRNDSIDSRYFGAIKAKDIVGKLSFRVYPINKFESF